MIRAADLFCGAGGTSQGLARACERLGSPVDLTAINHWPKAVSSHELNHPWATHHCAQIDALDPRKVIPQGHLDLIVAGVECVHHSKARGGQPIVDQARASAWHVIHWAEALHVRDILIENVPEFCFAANTMVLTEFGPRPIETVGVGTLVLTHRGRWRRVTATSKRIDDTVSVSGIGATDVECTANHRFLARSVKAKTWAGSGGRHCRQLTEPQWVEARDLVPDRDGMTTYRRKYSGYCWASPHSFEPIATPAWPIGLDEHNDSSWRMLGLWLGDGWIRKRRQRRDGIRICGNHQESALLERQLSHTGLTWNRQSRRSVVVFETTGTEIATWIKKHFGEYAHAKTLPGWILSAPPKMKRALLEGYIQADGHIHKKDSRIRVTTVSKRLAVGVKMLVDSLGLPAGISHSDPGPDRLPMVPTQTGCRAIRSRRRAYTVNWNWQLSKIKHHEDDDRLRWTRVQSVESTNRQVPVYDLTVEGDGSFVADGVVVHNCSWGPVDENGRRIKARSGDTFRAFVQALESLDYRVEHRIITCADFGDPTTRRRFFLRARLGRRPIEWPDPTHDRDGGDLLPWRTAREVIDWSDLGTSIFRRKRPLAPRTLARIRAGIERFCGDMAEPFLVMFYGTNDVRSVDRPVPTVTTGGGRGGGHIGLANPFLVRYYGCSDTESVDAPLSTVAGMNKHGLATPFLVEVNHGKTRPPKSLDQPMPTITTKNGYAVASPFLLPHDQFPARNGLNLVDSIDRPVRTVTAHNGDDNYVVTPFLLPYYRTGKPHGVDEPVQTVTTRDRFALVTPDGHALDIFFRMLSPRELARAQGFPDCFDFVGNKAEVVRQIGNAVPVGTAEHLCFATLDRSNATPQTN